MTLQEVDRCIIELRVHLTETQNSYDSLIEKMEAENLETCLADLEREIIRYKNSNERGATTELKALHSLRKQTRHAITEYDEKLSALEKNTQKILAALDEMRERRTVLYARAHGSLLADEMDTILE